MLASLVAILPLSLRLCHWNLVYSPAKHGLSVQTFYNRIADAAEGPTFLPTVVVVETADGCVFGGFGPHRWRSSSKFFGTDEAFVFTATENFRVYGATRANQQYQFSSERLPIVFGGGEKGSAIGIYDDWLRGSASACSTFGNTRFSPEAEFVVRNLEVWYLIPE